METGKGSIRTAPRMTIDANNVITITGLPKTNKRTYRLLWKGWLGDS